MFHGSQRVNPKFVLLGGKGLNLSFIFYKRAIYSYQQLFTGKERVKFIISSFPVKNEGKGLKLILLFNVEEKGPSIVS